MYFRIIDLYNLKENIMSLVKFRNSWPIRNIMTSDFFNDRLWPSEIEEPAMNIKETDANFEIALAAPGYSKKILM
tara:strand:- start:10685 stop:10909 length:225 start_codon:yes stop_codon:yes gene_type:complete